MFHIITKRNTMKRLSTFIYGAIILLGIYSCSNEEADIFGKSSAQRLNEAVAEYSKLLCSSENGWAMEYFANEKEKGYTLLMKFRTTGGVTIATKDNYTGNKYTEDNSMFEVIADNAPVLTFNTYNNLLHYFSNPEDDPNTEENENGRGHEGDYEFIVMKASQDLIVLKGKKRGYTIMLRRLSEGQDWEGYLNQLEEIKNTLFSNKIPTLWLTTANGEKYTLGNSTTGVFDAVPEGGDPISQTIKIPFVMQENGFRTLKPFTGGKEQNEALFSVQSFTIAEDGILICTDDGVSRLIPPSGREMFCNLDTWSNGSKWSILPTEMGGIFKNLYNIISEKSLSTFKYEFNYYFHINSNGNQAFSFGRKNITTGSKVITVVPDENDLEKVGFIVSNNTNAGWNNLLKYIPEVEDFVNLLGTGAFKVQPIIPMKPSTIKLISITDANDFLTISIE